MFIQIIQPTEGRLSLPFAFKGDKAMIIEKLTAKSSKLAIKQIKAVYEKVSISEEVEEYLKPSTRYTSPEQVYNAFSFLMQETKEYFLTLHLDGKNRIVCVDVVSIGSLNQSIVHPREVFKTACLSNAAAIILVHQHPSGDPAPSREDMEITRRLKEAGELLGIRVLDHIIIGEGYVSMTERGIL